MERIGVAAEDVAARHPGPRVPTSAAAARGRVQYLLAGRHPAPGVDPRDDLTLADILLVTSELVTNAIRHGGGVTGFSAAVSGNDLLLSVSDDSDELPRTVTHSDAAGRPAVGGYGWPLINRLSSDVSVVPGAGGGKTIHVVVPLG
ncbi:ATP-binding protein [Streptomyces sp. RFCAC02]|uniref:ATP-binding protein n=1 Tax=Streptomyces sp. RFCAC02 TaxID=2499143 RepID=UPI0010222D93|nr:ATP-binding protein [Streptomyces sp. RFCAC02]